MSAAALRHDMRPWAALRADMVDDMRPAARAGGAFGSAGKRPQPEWMTRPVRVLLGSRQVEPTTHGGPYHPVLGWASRRDTYTRQGLEALVGDAADCLDAVLRAPRDEEHFSRHPLGVLPWNLASQRHTARTVYGRIANHPRVTDAGSDMVEQAARFAGWLRTVAAEPALFPGIVRVLRGTQSPRGMDSPRTAIDLWSLVDMHPSPHRLERLIWRVKERATAILSAWDGRPKPSWRSIGIGISVESRCGKAAVIATAAYLVRGADVGRYCLARDALVALHRARHIDATDGVVCRVDPSPTYDRHGVRVYRAWHLLPHGRHVMISLVRFGTRVYHDAVSDDWTVRRAIDAWRRQDEAGG